MWCPKHCSRLAWALAVACWIGHPAWAEETWTVAATNQPVLRTLIRSEEVVDSIGTKPIQRAFFSAGTNRFAFVVPEDFKLDASRPGKLILTSPDYSCFITVQLVNPEPGEPAGLILEPAGLIVDSFRNQALDEFPGGVISNEFELRVGNRGGPAYELRWNNSSGGQQLACVGFIPSAAGTLKFSLLSNSENHPQNQTRFRCLLRSFQNNESGKLEIRPVSGAS